MPFIGGSNAQSKGWTESQEYDKDRFNYGGRAGGAAIERSNLLNRQQRVEERAAPQMVGTQLDQGVANQSRGFQMGSLAGLAAAASGAAPSRAELAAKQAGDRAARAQVSAAGTVRGGPGAQASAYRSASQTAATNAADIAQGVQAGRADEMATARGQLANAATATRGQDLTAATTNAQLGQDTAKTNLGASLHTTDANDSRAMGYEQLGQGVNQQQLSANIAQQQIASGARQHADTLNTQTQQQNVDRDYDLFKGALGLGQGVIGGVSKVLSDPNTKLPIGGSLAELGLGGAPSSGTVDIGSKGFASAGDIQEASKGLTGDPMSPVGGGGLTGGGGTPGGFMSDERAKEPTSNFRSWLGRASKGAPGDFGSKRASAPGALAERSDEQPGEGSITGAGKPKPERTWLDDVDEETKDAKPYERDPELAKPKASNAPLERGMAPGTDDWNKHGGGEKYVAPEGAPGLFESIFGGIANAKPFATPRDTMTSDPRAKQAAFEEGVAYSDAMSAGKPVKPPSYYKSDKGKPASPFAGASTSGSALTSREVEARKSEAGADEPFMATPVDAMAGGINVLRAQGERYAGLGVAPSNVGGQGNLVAPPPRPPEIAMSDERTKEGFARPSDEDMADAMRSMDPAVYAYKPNYRPGDQTPGEVNVGPMANEMAKDPVARTAIVRDDGSGMLAIDRGKAEKVIMGSLASLQRQLDELGNGDVPRGDAKKQRRSAPAHP